MTCITSADTLSPRQARRPLFCKSSRGLTMIFRFTTMGVAKRLHLHDFGQGRRLGQIHRLLDVGQSDSRTAVECARQIANGVFQITISLDTGYETQLERLLRIERRRGEVQVACSRRPDQTGQEVASPIVS